MASPSVRIVSDCFVQPRHAVEESKNLIHLTPWDIRMISRHYIQKGLLFVKPAEAFPREDSMASYLEKLKDSLSATLVHYYPLAGRLRTLKSNDPRLYAICIDCADSPGVRFIHATLDMTVSDILSPVYVPHVVQSFFDHDRAINHDGHTKPLISIQVTDLVDGVFVGCSFNHTVGDGTSYWNFLNAWSEIFLAQDQGTYTGAISRPPFLRRWFPEGRDIPINLPFSDPSEFTARYEAPILKERVFHFSAKTIAGLEKRANEESGTKSKADEISSYQSLCALVWRSIIRARRFPDGQATICRVSANDRVRMHQPGLPPDYFGNCVTVLAASTTAGQLLHAGLGAAASLLHVAVKEHTDERVNSWQREWVRSPAIYSLGSVVEPHSILISSSPRFNKYGSEFGLGKAVALRSGYANKFDGKVTAYPGREGGGSVDLEVCLSPEAMAAVESDEEFMAAVEI